MDCIQKILIAKGLGEEFHRAGLHGAHGHGNISVGGNKDDGDMNLLANEFCLQVQPTESRQTDVEDKAVRAIGQFRLKKVIGAPESFGFEAHRPQQILQRGAHRQVVFHNEHATL